MIKNYNGTGWDWYDVLVTAINGDTIETYRIEGITRGTTDRQKARECYYDFTQGRHMTVDKIVVCGECYYNRGTRAGGTGRKICRI